MDINVKRLRFYWHGYKDIEVTWKIRSFIKCWNPTSLEFKGDRVKWILWICGLSISY